MLPVQLFPGNKHIGFRAACEGVVTLLQDHLHVPHVAVHEVYQWGAQYHCIFRTTFHRACNVTWCPRLVDRICPGYIWGVPGGGGEGGCSQVSLSQPVLELPMGVHGPCHQVHITLRVEDLLVESIMVSKTLSHHPEAVGLRRVSPYCTTGLARYTQHLYHVGAHPKTAKQICQDGECLMYPCLRVDARIQFSAYKYAAIHWMYCSKPSISGAAVPSAAINTVTWCRSTASTTIFNIVG